MQRGAWIAVTLPLAIAAAAACSLITTLDAPRAPGDSGIECGNTMSDPFNCGACALSCLGGACDGGVCQPVAIATVDGAGFTGIYVDTVTGTVYGAASDIGSVYAIGADARAGSQATVALSGLGRPLRIVGQAGPRGLSIFVASERRSSAPGGIYEISSDGGAAAFLPSPSVIDGVSTPVSAPGIDVLPGSDVSIVWSNAAADGGATQIVQTNLASATSHVLAATDGGPHDVAVATVSGDVWFNTTPANLYVLPSGTSVPVFKTGAGGVFGYAPGAAGGAPPAIFFSDTNGGTEIYEFALTTSAAMVTSTPFASADVDAPIGFASDGRQYLYWTNNGSGSVERRSFVAGAQPWALWQSPAPPKQIAYDEELGAFFWTTDTSIVRAVAPP